MKLSTEGTYRIRLTDFQQKPLIVSCSKNSLKESLKKIEKAPVAYDVGNRQHDINIDGFTSKIRICKKKLKKCVCIKNEKNTGAPSFSKFLNTLFFLYRYVFLKWSHRCVRSSGPNCNVSHFLIKFDLPIRSRHEQLKQVHFIVCTWNKG